MCEVACLAERMSTVKSRDSSTSDSPRRKIRIRKIRILEAWASPNSRSNFWSKVQDLHLYNGEEKTLLTSSSASVSDGIDPGG
jgi:hypothetical protein